MSTLDLRSDAAFEQLLANVATRPNHSGESAREIADNVKASGGDAGDAAHKLICAGYGASHAGSWRGVINEVLGLATVNPANRQASSAKPVSAAAKSTAVAAAKPVAALPIPAAASSAEVKSTTRIAAVAPAAGQPAAVAPSVASWAAEYRASAALQQEFGSEAEYVALKKHEARATGQAYSATEPASEPDAYEKEWSADATLQAEFISAATYSAYRRAEARGGARSHRGAVQSR